MDRWRQHRGSVFALRAAIVLGPVAFAVAVASLAARLLPRPVGAAATVAWWVVVLACSYAAGASSELLLRRLLPLVALLRLSLVFPDRAPSRYRVAMQAGRTEQLDEYLERVRRTGAGTDDRADAAATILALMAKLSGHDERTKGHSERVRVYTDLLAEEMGLTPEDADRLRWAALVHDIGKLLVPAHVLNKPGRPSDEEWEQIARHPSEGMRIAGPLLPWLGAWGPAIEQHHERFDGTGYPARMAGADISLGGRIVAIADCYEVITAERAYKKPMTPEDARAELTRCAGTHFDPALVRHFLNISVFRLRRVAGPLSWFAQMPFTWNLGQMIRPLAEQVARIGGRALLSGSTAIAIPVAAAGAMAAAPDAAVVRSPARTAAAAVASPSVAAAADGPTQDTPPEATPDAPAASAAPSPNPPAAAAPRAKPDPTPAAVKPAGHTPVARHDAYTVSRDVVLDVAAPGVLANDTDADGDRLTVEPVPVTRPTLGTLTLAGDGRFVYRPGSSGSDTFVYRVSDGTGRTATGTVSITVTDPAARAALYLSSGFTLANSPMPTAEPEPDRDGDGAPGVTVSSTNGGGAAKSREWSTVLSAPLTFSGPVALELWTSSAGAHLNLFLRDCAADCRTLATGSLRTGGDGWVAGTIDLGAIADTVPAGHRLVVRITSQEADVQIASSGSRPSRLVW